MQLEEFVSAEDIFTEYAYFSSYSDSWVAHARRLRRDGGRALRPRRRTASWWSSPATTATCCSTSSSAASRRSASSPPPTSPRSRASKGIDTLVRFFGRETARDLVAEGQRADLIAANNVLAHVPDLNDFVGRHRDPAGDRRRGHDRVAAPAAAGRGQPVRHDLPRALPVLLAVSPPSRCSRPTGSSSSTSRSSKSHGGSLRLYAQRAEHRTPGRSATRVERPDRARARARASTRSRRTCAFTRSGRGDQVEPARVPDRQRARGQADRRLRRARARATRC